MLKFLVPVGIDYHLSFDKHVSDVCSSANYHIRALSHIRPSLTQDMAATLAYVQHRGFSPRLL